MTYDDLPDQIKRIMPKNKFGAARRSNQNLILVKPNYDNTWDRYRCVNGSWEYIQPGTILK